MARRSSLLEGSLKLYVSLQTRGSGTCSSRSVECHEHCFRSFSTCSAHAASRQQPLTSDAANSRLAPLHTRQASSSSAPHPDKQIYSGGKVAAEPLFYNPSSSSSSSSRGGIPPFPGLELEGPTRYSVAAAGVDAGLQLSNAAIDAVTAAIRAGDIAPLHSEQLRQLSALEAQFPGFSLDALLSANAAVLKIPTAKLRLQMRVFQDVAPTYLPPVGLMMPKISRWVAASPSLIAAKLHTLNTLCQRYLSMQFPADQLTPSATFMDLPEQAHAEAAFALFMVLGRQHGQRALASDISLLGLPAIQIEAVASIIREQLNIPLDQVEVVQHMVAAVPAVLHMKTTWVKARLEQMAERCSAIAGVPERLRQERRFRAREELRAQLEEEVQAVMREVLLRHPEALLERKTVAALELVERAALTLERERAAAKAAEEDEEVQAEGSETSNTADAGVGDKAAAAGRQA